MKLRWTVYAVREEGDPELGYGRYYPSGDGSTPEEALAKMQGAAADEAAVANVIEEMVHRVRL